MYTAKSTFRPNLWQWVALAGLCLLAALLALSSARPSEAQGALDKVAPEVLEQLGERGEAEFWLFLRDRADLSAAYQMNDWGARGQFVVDELQATAEASQAGLRALLDGRGIAYRSYWIANAMLVAGDRALLEELAARPEVEQILGRRQFTVPEPIPAPAVPQVGTVEWNIVDVNADDVWSTYGVIGEGIIVANIDTGVQYDHPAVVNQYRGNLGGGTYDHNYNWYDPSNVCGNPSIVPCDNNDHGTHTMGTMVGDDGGVNQIGVAPGAKWIAAKGCESSFCSETALLDSAQWIMAPCALGDDPGDPSCDADMRPHVVNNSWGGGGGDPWYQAMVDGWVASGIFPAFSNGNSGPSCGSSGSPGDYVQSYSAGAYDINHNIAGFSSRGPSAFSGEIKPNIAAPGVSVRSSTAGNGYGSFSGTSMASPHVAGTIALMWSASPVLVGDIAQAREIYDLTALDTSNLACGGTDADNNVWGEGRLDALAAVEEAILRGGPDFTLEATPEAQSICAGTNAVYQVDIGQILGFDDPVTLSASGHPAGSTANFSVNPVIPPGTSNLGIGNTGGVAPGEYNVEILGVAPTSTHTTTVGLSVFTNAPGAPTLVSPADGATGVVPAPTFEWTAASQADSYTLFVATAPDPGSIVYTAEVDGTSHTVTTPLEPLTQYFWGVRATNPCGDGAVSSIFSFTTADIPPILIVDDDDNLPDVRAFYTDLFDDAGIPYDLWDTNNSDNEPDSATLLQYDYVLWFTGHEWGGFAGPGSAGEGALATWLDSGDRCLFLTSQDYIYDRGQTSFMTTYLGLGSFTNDTGQSTVTGQLIYSDLGTITLSFGYTNFSDVVNPTGAGTGTVWLGNDGSAAIAKKTATYATMFLGYPLDAMADPAVRTQTLARFFSACN